MNKDKEIQFVTNAICTGVSVVVLLFHLCYGVFVKGRPVLEVLLKDPLSYITVFLPLVVSLLLALKNAANKGFSDKPYLYYLVATAATLTGVVLDFIVIEHYSLNTGWSIRLDSRFFTGLSIILLIAVIETLVFTGLDLDEFGEVFASVALPLSLLILALVNGCFEATRQMQLMHEDSVTTWILCVLLFGAFYIVEIGFFVILLIIPIMLLAG